MIQYPPNLVDPSSAQARAPQNIVLSPGEWPTNRPIISALSDVVIEGSGAVVGASFSLSGPLMRFPNTEPSSTYRANNANLPGWGSRVEISPVASRLQTTLALVGGPLVFSAGWYIITSNRRVINGIGTFNICRELTYISTSGTVSSVTVVHSLNAITGEAGFGSIYDEGPVYLVPVSTVVQNLTLRNLTLKGQWGAHQSPFHSSLLYAAFCYNVVLENVTFDGFDAEGSTFVLCRKIRFLGCAWENSTGIVGGSGYGWACYGCDDVEAVDPWFAEGVRRCPYWAYGGGSYRITDGRSFNLNHGDPNYSGPGSCFDLDHGLGKVYKAFCTGWRHEGTGGGFALGNGAHRESSQDAATIDDCDFGRGDCYIQDDSSGGVITNTVMGRLFMSGCIANGVGELPEGPTAPSDFTFDNCWMGSFRTTDFSSGVPADQRLSGTWDLTDCVLDGRFFEALPMDLRSSSSVVINLTRCTLLSNLQTNRGAVVTGLNDGTTDAVITINAVDCVGYRDVASDTREFWDLQGTAGVLNLTNFIYHRPGTGAAVRNTGGTPWTVNQINTQLGTNSAPAEDPGV